MTADNDKSVRTDKEGVSEDDKEQPMDVDKKPCDESTASTQSTTANRPTEEEPERIVKVSCNHFILFNDLFLYCKCLGF